MEILDIILFLPLAYGAWQGFKKGFIMELFTVLALVVGLYAAFNFSDQFSKKMDFGVENHSYLPAISFIILFLLVGAMVYFGGKALEQVIKIAQLSPLNKGTGAVLGFVKTLYISACILVFLVSLDKDEKIFNAHSKKNSLLYDIHLKALNYTLPGVKHSQLISVMDIQETANKTRMSYEEAKKAKQVADSLGLDKDDVMVIKEIHENYGKE